MESGNRRPINTRLLGPIAGSLLAMGLSIESHADITNVTSIARGTLDAEAHVGYVSPPSTIRSDVKSKTMGNSIPVPGLPSLTVGDATTALTSTTVAGYVSGRADLTGSVSRSGEVVGDTLSASFGGASSIDVIASLYKAGGKLPTNMVARATGNMSTTGGLTFTVNVPSHFSSTGFVQAFGPSTSRATLVVDGTQIALFDFVASQTEYDPSAPTTHVPTDITGLLAPGTYTLHASSVTSDSLEETALSVAGDPPRTRASARFSLQLDITPIP